MMLFECGKLAKVFSLITMLLLAGSCSAQSAGQNPALSPQDEVMKLMREQIGLDGGNANAKNPNGLRIQFASVAQLDNPGMHVYRLLVPGAPEGQEYTLGGWRIGAGIKYAQGHVYVNAVGLVMLHRPTIQQEKELSLGKSDEVEVGVNAARGEPVRYMMASADDKLFYAGTLVPFPIESKDGKCELEVRLGLPEGQTMLVYGNGLPPNAHLQLKTDSEGEERTSMMNTDAQGRAAAIIVPYVAGKDTGVVKMSVAAPGCSVAVEIPWGKGSYHPH